jgi:glucokinase
MLADAAAIFDPEAVVLGGGLVNAGDFLIAPTRASFERHVLARYKGRVKILVSSLNNGQAGILGAASFGRDAIRRARFS